MVYNVNSPKTSRPQRNQRSAFALAVLATSITMTLAGCSCSRDPAGNGTVNGTTQLLGGESEANLVAINQALAATENMEPEQAESLWAELRNQFPDDPSVALNRALNALREDLTP